MLTKTPLDHLLIYRLSHLRTHVLNAVVLAEVLKGRSGQHQLDKQIRVANGEVKFDKSGIRLTADSDVTWHLIEGLCWLTHNAVT